MERELISAHRDPRRAPAGGHVEEVELATDHADHVIAAAGVVDAVAVPIQECIHRRWFFDIGCNAADAVAVLII